MLKDLLKQEYYKQYFQSKGSDLLNKFLLNTYVIQQNKNQKNKQ